MKNKMIKTMYNEQISYIKLTGYEPYSRNRIDELNKNGKIKKHANSREYILCLCNVE